MDRYFVGLSVPRTDLTWLQAELRKLARINPNLEEVVRNETSEQELEKIKQYVTSSNHAFEDGTLRIDHQAKKVYVRGTETNFTKTEYTLLTKLVQHADNVLDKSDILRLVWGPEYMNAQEYVRTYVHRLRRKVETDTSNPQRIINRSYHGYAYITDRSKHP